MSVQTALKPLFDPHNPADGLADWDGDGLSNAEEFVLLATDFLNSDTDGDGFDDGLEIFELFSDPLDPDEPGVADPQEGTAEAVPPVPTSGETSGAAPPPAAGDSAPSSGGIAVVLAVPVPLTTSGTTPSNPATPLPQTGASPTAQPPVLAPPGSILSMFATTWSWEVQRGEVRADE